MLALTNAEDHDLRPTFRDHEELLECIRAGERSAALQQIHEHIDGSRRRLLAAYGRSRAGEAPAGTEQSLALSTPTKE
jgi:GntR family transcriptional regulator of gluconate operon